MAITAKDVKSLREKTGVGMMECKKALTKADGDMNKAIDYLREKGLAAAEKKASRVAAEGAVVAYYDKTAKKGVLVEVNSETDFVAKNEKFQNFCNGVAQTILKNDVKDNDVEALMCLKYNDTDLTVTDTLNELILAIGENMKVRRFEKVIGYAVSYIHAGGSVGVMVTFDTTDDVASKDGFTVMGKDVAMQIAAMSPSYLDKASVPVKVIEHEKEILAAQMSADSKFANKPQQVIEKIVGGKIHKYYKENCLVDQEFVKDSDLTVGKYIEKCAKELGGEIKVTGFIRYAKGEGIEKKEENFANEIANMIK